MLSWKLLQINVSHAWLSFNCSGAPCCFLTCRNSLEHVYNLVSFYFKAISKMELRPVLLNYMCIILSHLTLRILVRWKELRLVDSNKSHYLSGTPNSNLFPNKFHFAKSWDFRIFANQANGAVLLRVPTMWDLKLTEHVFPLTNISFSPPCNLHNSSSTHCL